MRVDIFLIALCLVAASQVVAWGQDGHEIVATIAQTQLHPAVRRHLCSILPASTSYTSNYPHSEEPEHHCHLAPFASWPDRVRFLYPWSSHLHYVNPVNDEPPKHCTYGEYGWQDHGSGNVLEALVNYTSLVSTAQGMERDIALRFLTHYMGDAHQPLHLTGRARGGNDIAVRFEGRYARLHTVWDSLLINSQIRELANYTTRLPSSRIESALVGKRFDPYIRWILAEGLGQGQGSSDEAKAWWQDEQEQWTSCPDPHAATLDVKKDAEDGEATSWLRAVTPHSSNLAEKIFEMTYNRASSYMTVKVAEQVDDTKEPVCPYAWTKPMHPLVCKYAFADPVPRPNETHAGTLAELDVPEYKGRIDADKVVQKQLAVAGLRLAAVLNTLLLPEALLAQEQQQSSSPFRSILTRNSTFDDIGILKRNKRHQNAQSPILSLVKVTAESIAEVFLLSSVGYFLARRGVLDKKTQTKINKLNVSFFTPALLFSKVAFTLNPGRLIELTIVPAGFVIITVVSFLAAYLLSNMAKLNRSQRNFSIACAITPNSNSLPVALMQSLVVTVPQLHWEEEGEPEDTPNGMLGRALTYLVLFSTLGMFLRWSVASKLLATVDEDKEPTQPAGEPPSEVRTGQLVDYQDDQAEHSGPPSRPQTPRINIRRSTEDGGRTDPAVPANLTAEQMEDGLLVEGRGSRGRQGPPGWARSFPNSPGGSDLEEDEEEGTPLLGRPVAPHEARRTSAQTAKKVWQVGIVKPFRAVTTFMTMPLYAAVISLVVAVIPPLQKAIASIEPVVGALETAGACSIPLTMVVLGAYFHEEADTVQPGEQEQEGDSRDESEPIGVSPNATLVGNSSSRRKSLPWMRNPWKSGDSSVDSSRNGSVAGSLPYDIREEGHVDSLAQENMRSNASSTSGWWCGGGRRSQISAARQKEKAMERRTILVAVCSRMILTPLVLMPLLAYYALSKKTTTDAILSKKPSSTVVDDPVFWVCASLLIGSPPALTLAQIARSASPTSSFERLISKTIFVSYAILAAPSTIILVLIALVIVEAQ